MAQIEESRNFLCADLCVASLSRLKENPRRREKQRKISTIFLFSGLLTFIFPKLASAHEAYVLSRSEFEIGLKEKGVYIFKALQQPENLKTFLVISTCILLGLLLVSFLGRTHIAKKIRMSLEKFESLGTLLMRLALAGALFFSALTRSFLGPELPLRALASPNTIQTLLFVVSGLLFIGFLTEFAALGTLFILASGFLTFGSYTFTYLSYAGICLVLLLFGSRTHAIDAFLFGQTKRFPALHRYKADIIRVGYGLALIFAAISIKFLHPEIVMQVIEKYNLTQFHLLFPQDPLLVVLGAALAELTIGIFIFVGFNLRITIIISLIYATLALFFFKELLWPHFVMYGISLYLLVNKQYLSLDQLLFRRKK